MSKPVLRAVPEPELEEVDAAEAAAMIRCIESAGHLDTLARLRRVESLAARLVAQLKYGQGRDQPGALAATLNRLEIELRRP